MVRNKKIFSLVFILIFAAVLCMSACGEQPQTENGVEETVPPERLEDSAFKGKLIISEVMVKNHATLNDEDGDLPDWIELHNLTAEPIDLSGFTVSDDFDNDWLIPGGTIEAEGYFLIYADGKDRDGEIPHADFSLSSGETAVVRDPDGRLVDRVLCDCDTADLSMMLDENENWLCTSYPSPGYENTAAGYDMWQETLCCDPQLVISEVMTYNDSFFEQYYIDYCDWIELKNTSAFPVELSEYYLSDDDDDLTKFQLPAMTLKPGKTVIVLCTEEQRSANKGFIKAPFALSSDYERVYLSKGDKLSDYVFLRDIPKGCSFGRVTGRNGWFFFDTPRPEHEKEGGYRRISRSPVSVRSSGIFNGVNSVRVELSGCGDIYYTTDGSLPTVKSEKYTAAFDVSKSCVVRAVAIENGAMVSRPLTLDYILNENHVLPVASLSTDSPYQFGIMYNSKKKDLELPGNLAFYDGEKSFTIPCGIDMHGETSLELPKKNMGIKFRGAYGQSMLEYDLFGGGVTRFGSLLLRGGQDFFSSIIKNELGENLCLNYSDNTFAQRSRYCVLYINGEYWGIYALMEKMNESHYATHRGVSKDSVTVEKAPVYSESDFYKEIIAFSKSHDLTKKENYEEFCRRMDIDSLIDWIIIEGYTGNTDLNPGNVRYAKSTEDDGKWRLMLFDMDSIMQTNMTCYHVVLGTVTAQYSSFITQLLKNADFKDRFLKRAAEVYNGALSDKSVLEEIDSLAATIQPEVARDYERFGMTEAKWRNSIKTLRENITMWHWRDSCIKALCEYFGSDSIEYFILKPD